jgi:hypothetical protein
MLYWGDEGWKSGMKTEKGPLSLLSGDGLKNAEIFRYSWAPRAIGDLVMQSGAFADLQNALNLPSMPEKKDKRKSII